MVDPPDPSGPPTRLLVIAGPTATGKTDLALQLALRVGGEVVGADSRQVYRHMEIGTARPTPAQRALVPHHLIDLAEPDQPFSLADYVALARSAIAAIAARGRLPLLVGGAGLYIRALLRGFTLAPGAPPRPELRDDLEVQARTEGGDALHRRLADLDPAGAARLDPRNVRRVVRALEIVLSTGKPLDQARGHADQPPYETLLIGLSGPRAALYARADRRIDTMMADGLLEEARQLRGRGYSPTSPAMTGLGYRELGAYLDGATSLEQAVQATRYATHGLIRRQVVWFRREEGIHWFSTTDPRTPQEVQALVASWLAGASPAPPLSTPGLP